MLECQIAPKKLLPHQHFLKKISTSARHRYSVIRVRFVPLVTAQLC